MLFDAVDLGATFVFAITALAYGLDPFVAAVLGMVTCIGSGVARGFLTSRSRPRSGSSSTP